MVSAGLGAIIGGALSAGGALLASEAQSEAIEGAADVQWRSLLWEMERWEKEQAKREPFYQAGISALDSLKEYVSGDFDITKTHEYKVQSEALDRQLGKRLSALGLQQSGYGVEEEARLKTGLMSDLYGQRFSRLASLANLGSLGFAQGPNIQNQINALSNLALAQGQIQANMWSGLGSLPMNVFNAYQMWKFLDRM